MSAMYELMDDYHSVILARVAKPVLQSPSPAQVPPDHAAAHFVTVTVRGGMQQPHATTTRCMQTASNARATLPLPAGNSPTIV